MDLDKAVFTLKLGTTESIALRSWLSASPENIVLPDPCAVLSFDGAVDVNMDEVDGCIAFHLIVNKDDLDHVRSLAKSLLQAISDDAVRLHQWVRGYASSGSNSLAFCTNTATASRNRVPGKFLYSDPEFIIVSSTNEDGLSAWYNADNNAERGVMLWDKRATRALIKLVNSDGDHNLFTRRGLAARGLPEVTEFTFTRLGGVPALIKRRQEENTTRLSGHPLASSVDLTYSELLYVDADLIYVLNWMLGVYWLHYRREGLPEKRKFEDGEGRKIAKKAIAAMRIMPQPGNSFRKWVEEQEYGFEGTDNRQS